MIAKYFWESSGPALKAIARVVRNPRHPQFLPRMVVLLSRCDRPRELFSMLPRRAFVNAWPAIQAYWAKRVRQSEARDWWETIYERLIETSGARATPVEGRPPAAFRAFGQLVREARLDRELSQRQLAQRVGMRQPEISRIEEGKQNATLLTVMRLCAALGIRQIEVAPSSPPPPPRRAGRKPARFP